MRELSLSCAELNREGFLPNLSAKHWNEVQGRKPVTCGGWGLLRGTCVC